MGDSFIGDQLSPCSGTVAMKTPLCQAERMCRAFLRRTCPWLDTYRCLRQ